MVAIPGDRLVLRAYSPASTIAGAVVLDAHAARRARLDAGALRRLEVLEQGSLGDRVALLAEEAGNEGTRPSEISLRLAVAPEAAEAAAREAAGLRTLRDGRIVTEAAWKGVLGRVEGAVKQYAETHRLREGIAKGELKSLLAREVPGPLFDEALGSLVERGVLAARGDRVSLPNAGPVFTPDQSKALETLERRLTDGGWQVPDVAELLKGVPPALKPQELIRYLVESGRVVKVTADLLYPAARWADLEAQVRQHFSRNPDLTMAAFKARFQVSRKYSIPILEHLDRTGLTRRQGDVRLPGPKISPSR